MCTESILSYDMCTVFRDHAHFPIVMTLARIRLHICVLLGSGLDSGFSSVKPASQKHRYLVKAATIPRNTFTRALCDTQSPEPLRKRGFLATPNFLEFL
jgi:hypothetical protein